MIFLRLIYEFFKIGLFAFGGGYATIPFLYYLSDTYFWYSVEELKQMIAVAAITPGPVGINMATYAGLKTAGIFGAIVATLSEILPSFIFVLIVGKLLRKYSDNYYVKTILKTLKPVGCALMLAVAVKMCKSSIIDVKSISLLLFLLILSWKSKKDPLFYILISGVVGIILVILGW